MSRYFSSAVRTAARIIWTFKGTTKNLEMDVAAVEQAVLATPELAKKVKKGIVNGDPHATKYADGTEDPIHISGILGDGNLKGSRKATSFHYYPETGDVKFSNPKYPPVTGASNVAAKSSSSAQSGAQVPAHQQAPEWV
ncbi:hypothetical protein ONS95_001894 [Cadophora gregata]|uniref:uncharacterized protein n=1 Tax=Cadophora gregata TaxID=51156 RepID=UPI0026DCBA47|nr:uncharacterized protein ONS95_001894 [Cadophora gregata]KAK0111541.1 hypothetical protein ONS95_001894 [Cadophora gregata]KAK0111983.1 hypothetical protein ONS96_001245 [Cadophora gregata f. sp. sojae]